MAFLIFRIPKTVGTEKKRKHAMSFPFECNKNLVHFFTSEENQMTPFIKKNEWMLNENAMKCSTENS